MTSKIQIVQAVFRLLKNRMYYCSPNSQGFFFFPCMHGLITMSVPSITGEESSFERILIVSLQELLRFL